MIFEKDISDINQKECFLTSLTDKHFEIASLHLSNSWLSNQTVEYKMGFPSLVEPQP